MKTKPSGEAALLSRTTVAEFRSSLKEQETIDYPFREPSDRKQDKQELAHWWALLAQSKERNEAQT